jgi:hypothetical protein
MSNLPQVLVNDTFKQTFIASGTDPSVIVASVLDGNGAIVTSGAGVNSLNGHFYRNVVGGVNTPGYYVSQWDATISGLPYKRRRRFQAIINEVD